MTTLCGTSYREVLSIWCHGGVRFKVIHAHSDWVVIDIKEDDVALVPLLPLPKQWRKAADLEVYDEEKNYTSNWITLTSGFKMGRQSVIAGGSVVGKSAWDFVVKLSLCPPPVKIWVIELPKHGDVVFVPNHHYEFETMAEFIHSNAGPYIKCVNELTYIEDGDVLFEL